MKGSKSTSLLSVVHVFIASDESLLLSHLIGVRKLAVVTAESCCLNDACVASTDRTVVTVHVVFICSLF